LTVLIEVNCGASDDGTWTEHGRYTILGPYPHASPIQFVVATPALQWICMLVGTCQMFVSSLGFYTISTIN
jgi:hypothetical protein